MTADARQVLALRERLPHLDADSLDLIFRVAHTHNAWLDKPVSDDTLRAVYDLAKMGPTSLNTSPARFGFTRPHEHKARR